MRYTTAVLLTSAFLLSLIAAPRELAVVAVDAPPERRAAVTAAVGRVAVRDVVIPAADADALASRYASGCSIDAACWARAGLAGAVGGIVIVGPGDHVAFVDVATVTRRQQTLPAAADDSDASYGALDTVIGVLLFPDRFARLSIRTVPDDASITIDDAPAGHDAVVAVGPHVVVVSAPGHTAARSDVTLVGGEARVVDVELASSFSPLPSIVIGTGAVLAAGGGLAIGLGEVAASTALADLKRTRDATHGVVLQQAETAQLIGGIAAGVGVVAVVVGISLLVMEPTP